MSAIKLIYNGLTIGDTSIYYVDDVDGLYTIPIRTSQNNLTDQDGGVIWSQKYAPRGIGISGTLIGSDVTNYLSNIRDLASAFSIQETEKYLTISTWEDTPTSRKILAKVTNFPSPKERAGESNFVDFRIEMTAEDPFFLDTTADTGSVGLAVNTGIPLNIPMDFPIGSTDSGIVNIVNSGDVEAFAKFTINGEVDTPTVNNTTTGEFFTINDTLNIGDEVVIERNQEGFSVTKNGSNIFDKFSGTFFPLAVGTNRIRFSAIGTSTTASLEYEFTNHYLTL